MDEVSGVHLAIATAAATVAATGTAATVHKTDGCEVKATTKDAETAWNGGALLAGIGGGGGGNGC